MRHGAASCCANSACICHLRALDTQLLTLIRFLMIVTNSISLSLIRILIRQVGFLAET